MKIDPLRFANLVLVPALLALLFFAGNMTTSGGEYDPWIDYDDTGVIDIFDAINLANAFGTSGNPTKLCNITNWPISDDVSVWWGESLGTSDIVWSSHYEASCFGRIHVLAYASLLGAGESVEIRIHGRIWNSAHTAAMDILAYTFTLDEASNTRDVTISVPSGNFRFSARTDSSSSCNVYLGFYLTWA